MFFKQINWINLRINCTPICKDVLVTLTIYDKHVESGNCWKENKDGVS